MHFTNFHVCLLYQMRETKGGTSFLFHGKERKRKIIDNKREFE